MQKLISLYESFLSLILPQEGSVIEIENIKHDKITGELPRANIFWEDDRLKALFQYRHKIVRSAIWEIKYRGNKKILESFSQVFYEFIIEEISDEILFSNFKEPIILPIPASKASLKERGIDQCRLLAKNLQNLDKEKAFKIDFSLLVKSKETPHQSTLKNKKERVKNLRNSFSLVNPEKILGRNIILIDDVITTGATMSEAIRVLEKAGARKILGFAIAH